MKKRTGTQGNPAGAGLGSLSVQGKNGKAASPAALGQAGSVETRYLKPQPKGKKASSSKANVTNQVNPLPSFPPPKVEWTHMFPPPLGVPEAVTLFEPWNLTKVQKDVTTPGGPSVYWSLVNTFPPVSAKGLAPGMPGTIPSPGGSSANAQFEDPDGYPILPPSLSSHCAGWVRLSELMCSPAIGASEKSIAVRITPTKQSNPSQTLAAALGLENSTGAMGASPSGSASSSGTVNASGLGIGAAGGAANSSLADAGDSKNPDGFKQGSLLTSPFRPPPLHRSGVEVTFAQNAVARNIPWCVQLAEQLNMISQLGAAVMPKDSFLYELIYPKGKEGAPKVAEKGKYIVKIYLHGEYRAVTIDDRIPVDTSGAPLFPVSINRDETWPLLLSKAYLKVFQGKEFDPQSLPAISLFTGWLAQNPSDTVYQNVTTELDVAEAHSRNATESNWVVEGLRNLAVTPDWFSELVFKQPSPSSANAIAANALIAAERAEREAAAAAAANPTSNADDEGIAQGSAPTAASVSSSTTAHSTTKMRSKATGDLAAGGVAGQAGAANTPQVTTPEIETLSPALCGVAFINKSIAPPAAGRFHLPLSLGKSSSLDVDVIPKLDVPESADPEEEKNDASRLYTYLITLPPATRSHLEGLPLDSLITPSYQLKTAHAASTATALNASLATPASASGSAKAHRSGSNASLASADTSAASPSQTMGSSRPDSSGSKPPPVLRSASRTNLIKSAANPMSPVHSAPAENIVSGPTTFTFEFAPNTNHGQEELQTIERFMNSPACKVCVTELRTKASWLIPLSEARSVFGNNVLVLYDTQQFALSTYISDICKDIRRPYTPAPVAFVSVPVLHAPTPFFFTLDAIPPAPAPFGTDYSIPALPLGKLPTDPEAAQASGDAQSALSLVKPKPLGGGVPIGWASQRPFHYGLCIQQYAWKQGVAEDIARFSWVYTSDGARGSTRRTVLVVLQPSKVPRQLRIHIAAPCGYTLSLHSNVYDTRSSIDYASIRLALLHQVLQKQYHAQQSLLRNILNLVEQGSVHRVAFSRAQLETDGGADVGDSIEKTRMTIPVDAHAIVSSKFNFGDFPEPILPRTLKFPLLYPSCSGEVKSTGSFWESTASQSPRQSDGTLASPSSSESHSRPHTSQSNYTLGNGVNPQMLANGIVLMEGWKTGAGQTFLAANAGTDTEVRAIEGHYHSQAALSPFVLFKYTFEVPSLTPALASDSSSAGSSQSDGSVVALVNNSGNDPYLPALNLSSPESSSLDSSVPTYFSASVFLNDSNLHKDVKLQIVDLDTANTIQLPADLLASPIPLFPNRCGYALVATCVPSLCAYSSTGRGKGEFSRLNVTPPPTLPPQMAHALSSGLAVNTQIPLPDIPDSALMCPIPSGRWFLRVVSSSPLGPFIQDAPICEPPKNAPSSNAAASATSAQAAFNTLAFSTQSLVSVTQSSAGSSATGGSGGNSITGGGGLAGGSGVGTGSTSSSAVTQLAVPPLPAAAVMTTITWPPVLLPGTGGAGTAPIPSTTAVTGGAGTSSSSSGSGNSQTGAASASANNQIGAIGILSFYTPAHVTSHALVGPVCATPTLNANSAPNPPYASIVTPTQPGGAAVAVGLGGAATTSSNTTATSALSQSPSSASSVVSNTPVGKPSPMLPNVASIIQSNPCMAVTGWLPTLYTPAASLPTTPSTAQPMNSLVTFSTSPSSTSSGSGSAGGTNISRDKWEKELLQISSEYTDIYKPNSNRTLFRTFITGITPNLAQVSLHVCAAALTPLLPTPTSMGGAATYNPYFVFQVLRRFAANLFNAPLDGDIAGVSSAEWDIVCSPSTVERFGPQVRLAIYEADDLAAVTGRDLLGPGLAPRPLLVLTGRTIHVPTLYLSKDQRYLLQASLVPTDSGIDLAHLYTRVLARAGHAIVATATKAPMPPLYSLFALPWLTSPPSSGPGSSNSGPSYSSASAAVMASAGSTSGAGVASGMPQGAAASASGAGSGTNSAATGSTTQSPEYVYGMNYSVQPESQASAAVVPQNTPAAHHGSARTGGARSGSFTGSHLQNQPQHAVQSVSQSFGATVVKILSSGVAYTEPFDQWTLNLLTAALNSIAVLATESSTEPQSRDKQPSQRNEPVAPVPSHPFALYGDERVDAIRWYVRLQGGAPVIVSHDTSLEEEYAAIRASWEKGLHLSSSGSHGGAPGSAQGASSSAAAVAAAAASRLKRGKLLREKYLDELSFALSRGLLPVKSPNSLQPTYTHGLPNPTRTQDRAILLEDACAPSCQSNTLNSEALEQTNVVLGAPYRSMTEDLGLYTPAPRELRSVTTYGIDQIYNRLARAKLSQGESCDVGNDTDTSAWPSKSATQLAMGSTPAVKLGPMSISDDPFAIYCTDSQTLGAQRKRRAPNSVRAVLHASGLLAERTALNANSGQGAGASKEAKAKAPKQGASNGPTQAGSASTLPSTPSHEDSSQPVVAVPSPLETPVAAMTPQQKDAYANALAAKYMRTGRFVAPLALPVSHPASSLTTTVIAPVTTLPVAPYPYWAGVYTNAKTCPPLEYLPSFKMNEQVRTLAESDADGKRVPGSSTLPNLVSRTDSEGSAPKGDLVQTLPPVPLETYETALTARRLKNRRMLAALAFLNQRRRKFHSALSNIQSAAIAEEFTSMRAAQALDDVYIAQQRYLTRTTTQLHDQIMRLVKMSASQPYIIAEDIPSIPFQDIESTPESEKELDYYERVADRAAASAVAQTSSSQPSGPATGHRRKHGLSSGQIPIPTMDSQEDVDASRNNTNKEKSSLPLLRSAVLGLAPFTSPGNDGSKTSVPALTFLKKLGSALELAFAMLDAPGTPAIQATTDEESLELDDKAAQLISAIKAIDLSPLGGLDAVFAPLTGIHPTTSANAGAPTNEKAPANHRLGSERAAGADADSTDKRGLASTQAVSASSSASLVENSSLLASLAPIPPWKLAPLLARAHSKYIHVAEECVLAAIAGERGAAELALAANLSPEQFAEEASGLLQKYEAKAAELRAIATLAVENANRMMATASTSQESTQQQSYNQGHEGASAGPTSGAGVLPSIVTPLAHPAPGSGPASNSARRPRLPSAGIDRQHHHAVGHQQSAAQPTAISSASSAASNSIGGSASPEPSMNENVLEANRAAEQAQAAAQAAVALITPDSETAEGPTPAQIVASSGIDMNTLTPREKWIIETMPIVQPEVLTPQRAEYLASALTFIRQSHQLLHSRALTLAVVRAEYVLFQSIMKEIQTKMAVIKQELATGTFSAMAAATTSAGSKTQAQQQQAAPQPSRPDIELQALVQQVQSPELIKFAGEAHQLVLASVTGLLEEYTTARQAASVKEPATKGGAQSKAGSAGGAAGSGSIQKESRVPTSSRIRKPAM